MSNTDICEAVRSTCILANVKLSALGLTRTDKDASKTVVKDHGAATGAARVVVSRLGTATELHKSIVKVQSEARGALIKYTMPYGNEEGWRLMPNVNYQKFFSAFGKYFTEMKTLKDQLIADAPAILAKAQGDMGTLDVPLPTLDEMINAYSMTVEFRDVSEGVFRGLPPEVSAKLQTHAARNLKKAAALAQENTLDRFVQPLTHFVDRMNAFEERLKQQAAGIDVGRHGVFRDSVVDNLKELAEVVGSFNITGDPRIAALEERIAQLTIDPDELRDDAVVRKEAVVVANDMLADLQDWLNPAPKQEAA